MSSPSRRQTHNDALSQSATSRSPPGAQARWRTAAPKLGSCASVLPVASSTRSSPLPNAIARWPLRASSASAWMRAPAGSATLMRRAGSPMRPMATLPCASATAAVALRGSSVSALMSPRPSNSGLAAQRLPAQSSHCRARSFCVSTSTPLPSALMDAAASGSPCASTA